MEGNGNLEKLHPGKYLADKLREQSMSRKELGVVGKLKVNNTSSK